MTREEWNKSVENGQIGMTIQLVAIIEDLFDDQEDFEQQIQKLQEENEHLKICSKLIQRKNDEFTI